MPLRIIEDQYIMTSQDYIADLPSDNVKGDLVQMDHIDPGVEEKCKLCSCSDCDCDNNSCKLCVDHLNGKHNQNKIENLNKLTQYILEDLSHNVQDIEKSYWKVTSPKDRAFVYLKRYKIPFNKGDIAFVIKQSIPKSKIKDHKEIFDKKVLPSLKGKASLISSGPEWYLLRPKKSSKLAKSILKKALDPHYTGLIAAALGIGGLSILAKIATDVYKHMKED